MIECAVMIKWFQYTNANTPNEEKQKILETVTLKEKIAILNEIISFYLHEISFNNQTIQ